MDVLHFVAHNICRGNRSAPQRPRAAVLKLSIVLAVMSPAFSNREPRELKVYADEPAVSQLKYCCTATVACCQDKVAEIR